MKVTKADFNSIMLYMEEEQVTIPCHTLESHAIAIQPRDVPSTPMITERRSFAARPRNATSTAMLMPAPTVIKPWSIPRTTTILPTPMIDFTSARHDVKVINVMDVKVNDDPDIEANDSPFVEQTPPKSQTYNFPSVKQQDILYNF